MALSDLETQLASHDAAIRAFKNPDVKAYTMPDGRSVERHSLEDLLSARTALVGQIAIERAKTRRSRRRYGSISE